MRVCERPLPVEPVRDRCRERIDARKRTESDPSLRVRLRGGFDRVDEVAHAHAQRHRATDDRLAVAAEQLEKPSLARAPDQRRGDQRGLLDAVHGDGRSRSAEIQVAAVARLAERSVQRHVERDETARRLELVHELAVARELYDLRRLRRRRAVARARDDPEFGLLQQRQRRAGVRNRETRPHEDLAAFARQQRLALDEDADLELRRLSRMVEAVQRSHRATAHDHGAHVACDTEGHEDLAVCIRGDLAP